MRRRFYITAFLARAPLVYAQDWIPSTGAFDLPEGLFSFHLGDIAPIRDPVIVVESYGTKVEVYHTSSRLRARGKPDRNRTSYEYYDLGIYTTGEKIFFRVESNPYAGEEICHF